MNQILIVAADLVVPSRVAIDAHILAWNAMTIATVAVGLNVLLGILLAWAAYRFEKMIMGLHNEVVKQTRETGRFEGRDKEKRDQQEAEDKKIKTYDVSGDE